MSAILRARPYLIIIILVAVLIPLLYFVLTSRDDGTLAEIRRRGTLRVGLDASFPPFETIDESGQIVGIDVDIARAIANDLGVELEPVNIGFDGLYDALLARRVDLVISGLPYDPRWTEDVAYSANYFNGGQILVSEAGEGQIGKVEEVAGDIVAVEWGSQADMEGRRLAEAFANVSILRRATADEALAALFNGEAGAAIVDAVSGAAFPQALHLVDYLTDEWYAAAVHIESRELLEAVNKSLRRLTETGEMDRIQARWLHGN